MAKSNRARRKPQKSEQNACTLLAGLTFSLVLIYFIQSAMAIADKHPLETAITSYEQQTQLEINSGDSN